VWRRADRGEEDEDEEEELGNGNMEVGQEALDRISIAIGGAVTMPAAFRYVPTFLNNEHDWRYRWACRPGILSSLPPCLESAR
jgi:hypothetical protein